MAKMIVNPINFACNKCGAQVFVLGREYTQQDGSKAYVVRCAKCRDNNGNPHMIKNVNEAYFRELIDLGRVVQEAPIIDAANFSMQSDFSMPTNIGTVANSTMGTAPDMQVGQVQGQPDFPSFQESDAAVRDIENKRAMTLADLQKKPQETVTVRDAVSQPTEMGIVSPEELAQKGLEGVVSSEPKPFIPRRKSNDCLLCSKHLAISIPDSGYAMAMKKDTITYFKEPVGNVVFMQKVAFCPICGSEVQKK